ncbi:MAG: class I SAM-dependent methyltransferase, partial [Flavobacteriales bacterium]
MSPPSNSFVKPENADSVEATYPLKVFVCEKCFLVQLPEHKSAKEIFSDDYVYFSSYSKSWLEHSKKYVDLVSKDFGLNSESSVIEIASNDGYLLQYFKEKNINVLGI